MHEVLVNRLGGLSLPRKSVVRLTDRPDMTLDVYRGRKTTIQQQQQISLYIIGSIVQYSIVQYSTVHFSTVQCSAVQHSTVNVIQKYKAFHQDVWNGFLVLANTNTYRRDVTPKLIQGEQLFLYTTHRLNLMHLAINTGWERTVHVSRCPALYSGRIFVPLCRKLITFVF